MSPACGARLLGRALVKQYHKEPQVHVRPGDPACMTQVLVYMSPACGALLLACAAMWERDALLPSRGLAVAARNPLGFTAALCMGFFVNLTTAYAIQMTSSLTFKARRPTRMWQRLHV